MNRNALFSPEYMEQKMLENKDKIAMSAFKKSMTKVNELKNIFTVSNKMIGVISYIFESMDEVPKQAYTMGIKNIMAAKKILLVATGSAKADALYKSLYGPITPNVPASILQLHQDVTVVADEDALSLIKEKGLL